MAEALAAAQDALVAAKQAVDDLQNNIEACDKELEELERQRKALAETALSGPSEDATEASLQALAQLLSGLGIA
eukprot:10441827-Lingulodinium_polyedra.AAC.1